MGRTWLVFELAQAGFFFAAFLSYIEAYILEKWCIYCVWSQGIIAAIFLLSALALLLEPRKRRAASTGAAASAPVQLNLGIGRKEALDCLRSDDLIGIGIEADAVRRRLHPKGVVSYAIECDIDCAEGDGRRHNRGESAARRMRAPPV